VLAGGRDEQPLLRRARCNVHGVVLLGRTLVQRRRRWRAAAAGSTRAGLGQLGRRHVDTLGQYGWCVRAAQLLRVCPHRGADGGQRDGEQLGILLTLDDS
jgi:hypothetical protein